MAAFDSDRATTVSTSSTSINNSNREKEGEGGGMTETETETETETGPMELRVRELLKEVHLHHHSLAFTSLLEHTLKSINEAINRIPRDITVTADEAPGFVRDIGGADKTVVFKFKKPASIEFGGSYSFQCLVKPDVCVDLFIRLPKDCFHKKDYLNHRYHAKRFLYLCIIFKYLKSSSLFRQVKWSTFQNEARKPILVVYPANELVEVPSLTVRIIPSAKSLFDASKLGLKRNNIRALNQEGIPPVPTPIYNSSILEDMFLEDNAQFLKETFLQNKEIGKALVLLKIWARQRCSVYSHDGLNGFLMAIIVAYLVSQEKVTSSMNPLRIFRITLSFIANSKSWSQGLYFQKPQEVKISKEERSLYKESFPIVICDVSGHMNLTFRMKSSVFLEIQDEAALTLKCLENPGDGVLEDVFMTKLDFPAKYDYYIRLNLKGNSGVYASGFCLDNECWRLYEEKVHRLLCQGLSDRARFIRVFWRSIPSECSIENGFSTLDSEPLLVGVSLSSAEKVFRVVDIGPDAENKEEAIKFRNFWGEKAELRRFKDGKIAESTVWESEHWSKHLIVKRIVEWVLLRHLSLSSTNIVQIVDQLDFSVLHGVRDPMSFSASLLKAFEALSKCLHIIEDIPLKVSSVQALDPAFRFTSVFPPEPHPLVSENVDIPRLRTCLSLCIQPVEVIIQLEGSGNWPMDDAAIEKTKTAFLIKIGESLQNCWGMTCTATEDDVDVFLSGYAFRLKILHERGLTLAKGRTGSGHMKWVPCADNKLFVRGQHASMINGLQGLYPIYGPVVRLSKRWVASHLFSACLGEEAVELLVAYLFVKALPFHAPCSRITGFLRFLRLLAEYDWTFSPLVIDINNDLSSDDKKEIHDNFMSSRKDYTKSMQNISRTMFLATSYDKASEAWTSSSPTSMELKRLVAYARSSANLLTKLMLQDQTDALRWECLFRTPLNNYNAVILLHADRLPYPERLLFPSQLNEGRLVAQGSASEAFRPWMFTGDLKGSLEELKNKLMIKFDPVRWYVEDLEKEFGALKLWYDSLGGDAIGLTWERNWAKKESEGVEDPIAMLKAVGEAGEGLVKNVYLVKAPSITAHGKELSLEKQQERVR